jgi:hypothetical protein
VGEDDRHISSVDADGVALAALQGLHQVVREKEEQIESLQKNVLELRQALKALTERLDRAEDR